jgi:hypothetical protein
VTLRIAVAAPFRHLHKAAMRKSELVYYYAYDRNWMNTDEATMLVKNAEEDGLLSAEGDLFRPSFDPATVTIPLGFRPPSSLYRKKDLLGGIVTRIARSLDKEETEVVAEMNSIIKEDFDNNLLPEAALAILARRHNVPIEGDVAALEKNIRKEDR